MRSIISVMSFQRLLFKVIYYFEKNLSVGLYSERMCSVRRPWFNVIGRVLRHKGVFWGVDSAPNLNKVSGRRGLASTHGPELSYA